MHVQMSCKYFVLEVLFINNSLPQIKQKNFFQFLKKNNKISTFEKSIKMLKNYTYNHIYLLNVFVMLNQKRFMLDEMTTRKMANFEEFSLVNNNILIFLKRVILWEKNTYQ